MRRSATRSVLERGTRVVRQAVSGGECVKRCNATRGLLRRERGHEVARLALVNTPLDGVSERSGTLEPIRKRARLEGGECGAETCEILPTASGPEGAVSPQPTRPIEIAALKRRARKVMRSAYGAASSKLPRFDSMRAFPQRHRMRKLAVVAVMWMGCGGIPSQANTRRIPTPHDEGFTPWPTEIAHLSDATSLFAGAQPCVLRASGEAVFLGASERLQLPVRPHAQSRRSPARETAFGPSSKVVETFFAPAKTTAAAAPRTRRNARGLATS